MQRVTITIPDELQSELDAYLERDDSPDALDTVVEDALWQYLMTSGLDDREYRPFRITPIVEKDDKGEPDVSINHDKYLAER